jgi:hypothetical protein
MSEQTRYRNVMHHRQYPLDVFQISMLHTLNSTTRDIQEQTQINENILSSSIEEDEKCVP